MIVPMIQDTGGGDNILCDDRSDGNMSTDGNNGNEEDISARKTTEKLAQQLACKILEAYANSIPNGTIEVTLDDTPDEGADEISYDVSICTGEEGEEKNARGTKKKSQEKSTIDGENSKDAKKRRSYKPAGGSVIMEYLDGIRVRVAKDDQKLAVETASPWIPPPLNPMSKAFGADAKPSMYYLGNVYMGVHIRSKDSVRPLHAKKT